MSLISVTASRARSSPGSPYCRGSKIARIRRFALYIYIVKEIAQGIIDEEEFNVLKELKELKRKLKQNQEITRENKSSILMID